MTHKLLVHSSTPSFRLCGEGARTDKLFLQDDVVCAGRHRVVCSVRYHEGEGLFERAWMFKTPSRPATSKIILRAAHPNNRRDLQVLLSLCVGFQVSRWNFDAKRAQISSQHQAASLRPAPSSGNGDGDIRLQREARREPPPARAARGAVGEGAEEATPPPEASLMRRRQVTHNKETINLLQLDERFDRAASCA